MALAVSPKVSPNSGVPRAPRTTQRIWENRKPLQMPWSPWQAAATDENGGRLPGSGLTRLPRPDVAQPLFGALQLPFELAQPRARSHSPPV